METEERTFVWPRWLTPQMRWALFGALLWGMVAHGMGLWNKFSWHDDIIALFWVGSTVSSGRWMLHVLGWLETLIFGDGHFSLPVMNGLLSILCIGAATALLVHLLRIRRKSFCVLLGGVMVAFPAVAGMFGYMFTMPYYMLAMVMTVGGACLLCTGKRWWVWLIGVLLGGCSMGIYQTFLPMLLSTVLIWNLTRLAEKKEPMPSILKRMLAQALCIMGIAGFYFLMNRFFLQKFDMQMNTYLGMDQMETASVGDYLSRVGKAYREFFLPTRNVSADMYPMRARYLYLAMVCSDILLGIWQGIRLWRENRGKALLFFLLLALFPLANCFIYVMSDVVHGLMTFPLVTQTVLFVWLAERASERISLRRDSASKGLPGLRCMISGLAVAILGFTGVAYARFDNQCYLKAAFQQQQAISFFTSLAAGIKAAPGFTDTTPVVFLHEEKIADQTMYNIDELDFIHLDPYGGTIREMVSSYAWRSFMERWCGFSPVYADPTSYENLAEVQAMPHYPDDGSILRIGDVMVVNF